MGKKEDLGDFKCEEISSEPLLCGGKHQRSEVITDRLAGEPQKATEPNTNTAYNLVLQSSISEHTIRPTLKQCAYEIFRQ